MSSASSFVSSIVGKWPPSVNSLQWRITFHGRRCGVAVALDGRTGDGGPEVYVWQVIHEFTERGFSALHLEGNGQDGEHRSGDT